MRTSSRGMALNIFILSTKVQKEYLQSKMAKPVRNSA